MKKEIKDFKVTIIGAGNGGRAFAVYLSRLGCQVTLIYRTSRNIKTIKTTKSIVSTGEIQGHFYINNITKHYHQAIRTADLILIVLPASVHRQMTMNILPHLTNGQIILLNPGRTWGAIEVHNIIKTYRPNLKIFVGETETLLFTSRKLQDYGVNIAGIKNMVDYCFYPESSNSKVKSILDPLFPQFHQVDDIRLTSLNNIGAILHPVGTILNAGTISRGVAFDFYTEGMTKYIAQVVQRADEERCAIITALGLKPKNFLEWARDVYGCKKRDYYQAFQSIKSYIGIKGPQSLQIRYLTEDVPTGLVPLSSLGKKLDIPTPTIDSLITLANVLLKRDFYQEGRTIENVGLPLSLIEPQSYISDIFLAPEEHLTI